MFCQGFSSSSQPCLVGQAKTRPNLIGMLSPAEIHLADFNRDEHKLGELVVVRAEWIDRSPTGHDDAI